MNALDRSLQWCRDQAVIRKDETDRLFVDAAIEELATLREAKEKCVATLRYYADWEMGMMGTEARRTLREIGATEGGERE